MSALNIFYRPMGVMKKMVIAGGIFLGFPPSNPPALLARDNHVDAGKTGVHKAGVHYLPGTSVSLAA